MLPNRHIIYELDAFSYRNIKSSFIPPNHTIPLIEVTDIKPQQTKIAMINSRIIHLLPDWNLSLTEIASPVNIIGKPTIIGITSNPMVSDVDLSGKISISGPVI